jgi:MFS family permease
MRRDLRLVIAMCTSEMLGLSGVFTFPALLPLFFAEWGLTSTEAGWIGGIYFAGYAMSAAVLLSLTDHIDARLVYLGGALASATAAFGFAMFAEGFWTALIFRGLAGIGLAGMYMPGLKALMDRLTVIKPVRALAYYTSSFSLGTAISFLVTGGLADLFGWRAGFWGAGVGAILSIFLALAVLRPQAPKGTGEQGHLLDFRPVFKNRQAMGYVLGYTVHVWELFALRTWTVAFLAFVLTLHGGERGAWPAPTAIAGISALVATVSSIIGNEAALNFGRRPVIIVAMLGSAVMAFFIGWTSFLSYGWVVTLILLYSAFGQVDSAALTAGAVESAQAGRRGATMAVHTLLGFTGGFLGSLTLGVILDQAGGPSHSSAWGWAFASLGLVGLLGPMAILRLGSPGSSANIRH